MLICRCLFCIIFPNILVGVHLSGRRSEEQTGDVYQRGLITSMCFYNHLLYLLNLLPSQQLAASKSHTQASHVHHMNCSPERGLGPALDPTAPSLSLLLGLKGFPCRWAQHDHSGGPQAWERTQTHQGGQMLLKITFHFVEMISFNC